MNDLQKSLEIINLASVHNGVPFELVVTKGRKRPVVKARQQSMYFVDMFSKQTLHQKGALFGLQHCDIIYARGQVNALAEVYKTYREDLDKLRCKIVDLFEDEFSGYVSYDTDKFI